jgi:glycosyltransferase involved in cell wall biosynthesis
MRDKARRTHVWAPEFGSRGGGIAVFSGALAGAIASEAPDLKPGLFGKAAVPGMWKDCAVRGTGTWPSPIRSTVFAGLVGASAYRERPSVIVSTHLNFGPAAQAIRALWQIPYVLVAHGIDVHAGLSRTRLAALRHADAVWAVSRWTRQRLQEIGVPAARIHLVPNTVSEDEFTLAAADARLRSRYGLQPSEKVVLTVARLDAREAYKGYDKVLRALPAVCAAIGDVRYLVVGKGSDSDRLSQLAAELGVANRLTLCGFVPDEDLAAHYRLADVFAMPSSAEGFGIVFLEAMACGVPVLAGNRDGSVDALADGQLGRLVDPDNVASIAAGLIDLLARRGPGLWFDPPALRRACLDRFGSGPFRRTVRDALSRSVGERTLEH